MTPEDCSALCVPFLPGVINPVTRKMDGRIAHRTDVFMPVNRHSSSRISWAIRFLEVP